MTSTLEELRGRGVLSPLDDHFARSMMRLAAEAAPEVLLAVALASRQVVEGDVCVDLRSLVERRDLSEDGEPVAWPSLDAWLAQLSVSRLVAGGGGRSSETAPLVLDSAGRLYLRRFWEDEQRVARDLAERAAPPDEETADDGREVSALRGSIERLLPAPGGDASRETHWPRVAAAIAVSRRLCVIAGRPGTGKTTTAAGLLAVLIERAQRAGLRVPRIALAAPTGKAAARLAEAVGRARAQLRCGEDVRLAIPTEAATLHRLLGLTPGGRPGRAEPSSLRADVVLVDEASMVDLRVAARLVRALPPHAKLLLLGDADQLASVEAGSVFSDLCGPRRAPEYGDEMASWIDRVSGQSVWAAQSEGTALRDCVVTLTTSHRYGEGSGIGGLARAIQSGDGEAALAVLGDDAFPDVRLAPPASHAQGKAEDELQVAILQGYDSFVRGESPRERLAALERFRVLCAVREGPCGVANLNRDVDAALVESGHLMPAPRGLAGVGAGRPILVTRNAPHLRLYNGDVGVTDPGGAARAFFDPVAGLDRFEGREGNDGLRRFGTARLPAHEPVFAMTVHKSQGSEFDEVALVLPPEPIPLLTRELLYTAVTRAREKVVVYGRPEVLLAAVGRRTTRASGLRDLLWGPSR